ncbi:hypothetical protein [Rhizobiales bacterium 3FA27D7]|mgnify:CR=1 FL=1|jgi:hypothetical protein|uniref:hypothetical protein n=1 Tax=Mesorhizobium sp. 2RAF21 TaxID=3232995 RepID=UPI001484D9FC
MISTFADLIFALLPFATGMVGYALGRAASGNCIRDAEVSSTAPQSIEDAARRVGG